MSQRKQRAGPVLVTDFMEGFSAITYERFSPCMFYIKKISLSHMCCEKMA